MFVNYRNYRLNDGYLCILDFQSVNKFPIIKVERLTSLIEGRVRLTKIKMSDDSTTNKKKI